MIANNIHLGYHGYPDPTHAKVMTLANSDITGTIHKNRGSNSGEHADIVSLCVQFLTF
jgi:hypothetical protein